MPEITDWEFVTFAKTAGWELAGELAGEPGHRVFHKATAYGAVRVPVAFPLVEGAAKAWDLLKSSERRFCEQRKAEAARDKAFAVASLMGAGWSVQKVDGIWVFQSDDLDVPIPDERVANWEISSLVEDVRRTEREVFGRRIADKAGGNWRFVPTAGQGEFFLKFDGGSVAIDFDPAVGKAFAANVDELAEFLNQARVALNMAAGPILPEFLNESPVRQ